MAELTGIRCCVFRPKFATDSKIALAACCVPRSLTWNAWQPDDLIRQVDFSILSDESMQAAGEPRESEFL